MDATGELGSFGGSEETTWMATTPAELVRLKEFRHALPQGVDLIIDERRRTYPEPRVGVRAAPYLT